MIRIGRKIAACAGLFFSLSSIACAAQLMSPNYTFNKPTVIEGAKLFAKHCSACHAVSNLRYNRLAVDLGMSPGQVKKDIMLPNGAQYLKGMEPAMTPTEAVKWFGKAPPNLSHMERAKGARWIYTYLNSFYWDPKRPSGWNNHMFPDVAMPNVLEPWNGIETKSGKVMLPGRLAPAVAHQRVADIVAFLKFASDPSIFKRHAIAPYVLGTLIFLAILAYALKKEFWKDVRIGGTGSEPSLKKKSNERS